MSPLLIQLVAAAALALVMTLVHGTGVVAIAHGLSLDRAQSRFHRLHWRTLGPLSAIALSLFCLHLVEIALFALFYHAVGAAGGFEEALYVSASAYSTLGQPDAHFPDAWRIVGALEGLIGFLLIGWSTALFVTDMNKLLRD